MTELDPRRLRALIKNADPASSLAPLRADQIARLTEDTMSSTTRTDSSTRRRPWLFAGLGVVAAGAAAAIAIPLALGTGGAPSVLDQPQAGGPAAMCAEVTAEVIAGTDSAFRATVTGIADGKVTLTVDHRFTGEIGGTVEVPQGTAAGVDGEPIAFENGQTYLIATRAGTVLTCGISGIDSPELEILYERAFPG